jgi:hypothetical protein
MVFRKKHIPAGPSALTASDARRDSKTARRVATIEHRALSCAIRYNSHCIIRLRPENRHASPSSRLWGGFRDTVLALPERERSHALFHPQRKSLRVAGKHDTLIEQQPCCPCGGINLEA